MVKEEDKGSRKKLFKTKSVTEEKEEFGDGIERKRSLGTGKRKKVVWRREREKEEIGDEKEKKRSLMTGKRKRRVW